MGPGWTLYLALMLPLPLISVMLLTTCGKWRFVRRGCRSASGLKFYMGSVRVSLRAICFTISVIMFVLCARATTQTAMPVEDVLLTPSSKIQIYSKKWRNERNFWISALVLLLWYVLGGLMRLQEENAALRYKLKELNAISESESDLEDTPPKRDKKEKDDIEKKKEENVEKKEAPKPTESKKDK